MHLRFGGATKTGLHRKRNEDTYSFAPEERVAVVADGIGGRPRGDVASDVAAATIVGHVGEHPTEPAASEGPRKIPSRIEARLVAGIRLAHERIRRATEAGWGQGMGTTVVSAVCDDEHAWIAHVGDSRAYRIRDGSLCQLTEDHTMLEALRKIHALGDDVGPDTPLRHQLTRALGVDESVDVAVRREEAQPGDRLLLCSDGVPHALAPERIVEIVAAHEPDLLAAARALVAAAREAGEPDDTTAVLVAWDDAAEADTVETEALEAR